MVRLHDLKALFQLEQFCDSIKSILFVVSITHGTQRMKGYRECQVRLLGAEETFISVLCGAGLCELIHPIQTVQKC